MFIARVPEVPERVARLDGRTVLAVTVTPLI